MPLQPLFQASKTGVRVKHARSTNFYDNDEVPEHDTKRPRSESSRNSDNELEIENRNREVKNFDDGFTLDDPLQDDSGKATNVETALAPIRTDQEAIDEYEASQAAKSAEDAQLSTKDRLETRKWVRGKSSIYVDAFNLALDSVLDEESHLFDDTEMAVFKYWSELSYEAQYL
jgi:fanconi-associated nuclease 1